MPAIVAGIYLHPVQATPLLLMLRKEIRRRRDNPSSVSAPTALPLAPCLQPALAGSCPWAGQLRADPPHTHTHTPPCST